MGNIVNHALITYKEVEAIFDACTLEVTTSKEKAIYINEARKTNHPIVLAGLPLFLSRPITFLEDDAYVVHFPHNNALIVIMHIDRCRVSKILIDSNSSINILYESSLNKMEDTSKID